MRSKPTTAVLACILLIGCGSSDQTAPVFSSLSEQNSNLSSNLFEKFETSKNVIVSTAVEWKAPSSRLELLPSNQETPVWRYKGSTYIVWVDSGRRPWVT